MNHRVCAAVCVLTLAASLSGCCCMDRYYYGDCPPTYRQRMTGRWHGRGCVGNACLDGACHDGACADGACGGGCASGNCGTPTCGGCGACNLCCVNPFKSLWRRMNCASGCGEFYFDEWINNPPECDPCDDHGCYIGPQSGCKKPWLVGARFGYRCGQSCDTCCGYDEGAVVHGDGTIIEDGVQVEEVPTPAQMQPTPMREPMLQEEPVMEQARRTRPYYNVPKRATPATRRASYEAPPQRTYSASTRTASFAAPTTSASPVGSGVRR